MDYLSEMQLVALQGDGAKNVMSKLSPSIDFSKMPFMTGIITTVAGIEGHYY